MTKKNMRKIMVLLSMAYGILIGIIAIAHAPGLGLYAIVGAAILAVGWTASGLFGTRPVEPTGERPGTPQ